jgi:hypothetical protein
MTMECPFCGVQTDAPHESQEACIAALHAEIDRVRLVVDCVRSAVVPEPPEAVDEPPSPLAPEFGEDQEPQF